jgi:hypothetical protein
MSNIIPVSDMTVMADSIVKSGFYGFKNKEQVMAVMLVAQAENKHPATVVQEYDIIQGKPALKSQAILARFQLSGGSVQWDVVTPKAVKGTFKHPQGGTLTVEWTIEMAKQAGIYRDGSGWSKYPEDMLRARVISRAVRSIYPACILGHYATEEVMDFDSPMPKHMGVVEEVTAKIGKRPSNTYGDLEEIPSDSDGVVERGGAYPIVLPDGSIYASYESPDEWILTYADLASKVMQSTKLTDEQRTEKIAALAESNKDVTEKFSSFDKIKIRGELAKVGVNLNPKSPASQFVADMEANEKIF